MKSLSVPKIISECRELVKLYHINRSGPGFLRHSVDKIPKRDRRADRIAISISRISMLTRDKNAIFARKDDIKTCSSHVSRPFSAVIRDCFTAGDKTRAKSTFLHCGSKKRANFGGL